VKNPYEVLRAKELELQRIQKEVEALRLTAELLDAGGEPASEDGKTNLRQMVPLP
jgi:hypothetical protein